MFPSSSSISNLLFISEIFLFNFLHISFTVIGFSFITSNTSLYLLLHVFTSFSLSLLLFDFCSFGISLYVKNENSFIMSFVSVTIFAPCFNNLFVPTPCESPILCGIVKIIFPCFLANLAVTLVPLL